MSWIEKNILRITKLKLNSFYSQFNSCQNPLMFLVDIEETMLKVTQEMWKDQATVLKDKMDKT